MSWTIDAIIDRIRARTKTPGFVDWQQVHFLCDVASHLDPDTVVARLLDYSRNDTHDDRHDFLAQEYVGKILWELRPKCTIPPADLLRPILKTYEHSVEEIACYLAANYGPDTVERTLDKLSDESLTAAEQRSIHVLRYWLIGYRHTQPN